MGNTYQARGVIGNVGLPVSGGIIREEHLNNEFTNIIAAFNSSSGHSHNGTDSPRVVTLGANSELGTSSNAITPGTATIDVGANGNKFRDGFYSGTVYGDTAIQSPKIKDTNGRESIVIAATSTAVNHFTVTNAATTNDISISATGSDTNVSMALTPKGTGLVKVVEGDLAIVTGGTATAVTASAAELNKMDGVTSSTAEINLLTGKSFVDEDDMISNSPTAIASQQSIKTYIDAQNTAQDLDIQGDSGGQLAIDLDAHVLDIAGGTGIDTSGSGQTITVAIDSTVATLTGSQTLTNKTLTTTNSINTGTGFVAVKNGGARSELRLYCESANQHYLALLAPPHGTFTGNPNLTFPTPSGNTTDTLVSQNSTDTLANKTLRLPKIDDTSFNHHYVFAVSELLADRTVTLPLLTGDDEFVFKDHTQTLTNKTLTSPKLNENVALTSTSTQLNYNNISTLGTSEASKVVTANASNHIYAGGEFKAKHYKEQYAAVTSASGVTLDLHDGNLFQVTMGHSITFTFNNPPSSGDGFGFTLKLIQDGTGNRTATWPASVKWAGGSAPTLTGTANSVDVFTFFTHDAGTTYYGFTAGLNLS